jgi:hypothetical protein
LLHDVCEFVREQVLPGGGIRLVASGVENDVTSNRVGVGIDGLRGSGGTGIGVNLDPAEIVFEARFEERASFRGERLSCGGEDFMHRRWDDRSRFVCAD